MTPSAARLAQLDEYVKTTVANYAEAGFSDAQCAELEDALRLPKIAEWMDYVDAQSIVMDVSLGNSGRYTKEQILDANRTSATATDNERAGLVSDRLGISFAQALRQVEAVKAGKPITFEDEEEAECAVYRHFDADGVLLYVGIAISPQTRRDQHAASSPWFRFAVVMTEEWHSSRSAAAHAEREAITHESPVFNKTHGGIDRPQRATHYLATHAAYDLLQSTI